MKSQLLICQSVKKKHSKSQLSPGFEHRSLDPECKYITNQIIKWSSCFFFFFLSLSTKFNRNIKHKREGRCLALWPISISMCKNNRLCFHCSFHPDSSSNILFCFVLFLFFFIFFSPFAFLPFVDILLGWLWRVAVIEVERKNGTANQLTLRGAPNSLLLLSPLTSDRKAQHTSLSQFLVQSLMLFEHSVNDCTRPHQLSPQWGSI